MQLKIQNGIVELSGEAILKEINIEINGNSKIGIVGRNGCGKTTLLKTIAGEYNITKLDSDENTFFAVSGKPNIGMLSQMTFSDENKTLIEEIRSAYDDILKVKFSLEEAQAKMEADQSITDAELEAFGAGSLRMAAVEGDVKKGSFMAGQIAGLVKKEQTVQEIIEEIIEETVKCLEQSQRFIF